MSSHPLKRPGPSAGCQDHLRDVSKGRYLWVAARFISSMGRFKCNVGALLQQRGMERKMYFLVLLNM